jgi:hypothetical protein
VDPLHRLQRLAAQCPDCAAAIQPRASTILTVRTRLQSFQAARTPANGVDAASNLQKLTPSRGSSNVLQFGCLRWPWLATVQVSGRPTITEPPWFPRVTPVFHDSFLLSSSFHLTSNSNIEIHSYLYFRDSLHLSHHRHRHPHHPRLNWVRFRFYAPSSSRLHWQFRHIVIAVAFLPARQDFSFLTPDSSL